MSDFVQWLTHIKACAPALEAFKDQDSYESSYNSLDRPDWLLWIYLRQSPNMLEVQTTLTALLGLMHEDLLAAIPDQEGNALVSQALEMSATLVTNEDDNTKRRVFAAKVASAAVIDPNTRGFVARSYALTLATRFLRLSLSHSPADAAEVGIEIGNAWTELEVLLGKVSKATKGADICKALRLVLPWKPVAGAST